MHSKELLAGNGTKNVLLEHTPTWLQIWPETANRRVEKEMIVVVSKWWGSMLLNFRVKCAISIKLGLISRRDDP